jgi:membrane-associated phospholipid phosphatase
VALPFVMLVLAQAVAPAPQVPPPDPPALKWSEEVPRFRASEYILTLTTGIAAIAEYVYLPEQKQPHWTGGVLFDDAVRSALRVPSPSTRQTLWQVAGVIGVSQVILVVGVDSVLVPLLRGSSDVMWQTTWIDLESYALGSIVTFTMYDTIGRARPSWADCQKDPSLPDCVTSPYASFPSGHAAEAYISAGLSCANHAYVPIYGSRLLDGLACARDLTLATADGVLRIMGDRHWATDVLAGGAIGFTAGYALPVVLHYAAGGPGRGVAWTAIPWLDGGIGASLRGTF